MTLIPVQQPGAAPREIPPVDPTLLEADAGYMIEGPFEWREHCTPCGLAALKHNPRQHRVISLYEVFTSYRRYRCCVCRTPLWQPENTPGQKP
jgi:hypothetical protein